MIKTSMIAFIAVMSFAGAANAAPVADETVSITNNTSTVIARKGADDPKGHNRGGEGAGHASLDSGSILIQMARRGADDPKGHNRGGEGAGHASLDNGSTLIQVARRGKDDGVGHG
jgi:hypothetical protein